MSDRRRHVRLKHGQPCVVVSEGRRIPAELIDVSLKGALLTAPAGLNAVHGAAVTLEIPLGETAAETIVMEAEIVAGRPGRLALLCRGIDVDSITHLRRLMELNLGDAALIERELGELGEGA